MNNRHATLFVFVGGWLSLLALAVGGSILLPPKPTASEASTALLYRYAGSNVSVRERAPVLLGRSIVADLSTMQLVLYEEGELIKSYPILSKGRPGTPWETPAGSYIIQTREEKHFSTIGGTWMPYSMQFYGNFFIHGWPTYADGKPVPIGYSGGCIRLATNDAHEVFDFVEKGARVTVLGGEVKEEIATSTTAGYYLRGVGKIPDVSSRAFLVEDVHSGDVLWERERNTTMPPRGLSRILAGLTALETVNQYKIVRLSELLIGKSVLHKHSIGAIDEMPSGVLIYPLLFGNNDTAISVYASEHGVRNFVNAMNEKSLAIGMEHTSFSGPESVDSATTTAEDLMTLLSYIKKNKKFILDATMADKKTLLDEEGDERYTWQNRNPWILSKDSLFRGGIVDVDAEGKGGALLLFDVSVSEFSTRTIAFVLLDSATLESDVEALRRFVSENYVYGVAESGAMFVKEAGEPTPNLLEKARQLIDLGDWLRGDTASKARV